MIKSFIDILKVVEFFLNYAWEVAKFPFAAAQESLFGDGLTSDERADRIARATHLIELGAATLCDREAVPPPTEELMKDLHSLEDYYWWLCCHNEDSDDAQECGGWVFGHLGVDPSKHADEFFKLKPDTPEDAVRKLVPDMPAERELFTHLLNGRYEEANALIHSEKFAPCRSGAKTVSLARTPEAVTQLLIDDLLIRSLFHIQRCAAWTYVVGHGGRLSKFLGRFMRHHPLKVGSILGMADLCFKQALTMFGEFNGQAEGRRGRPSTLITEMKTAAAAASTSVGALPRVEQVRPLVEACASTSHSMMDTLQAVAAERLPNVNEVRRRLGEPDLANLADLDLVTCRMHGIRPDALVAAMALCWLLMVERWKRLQKPKPSDGPVSSRDWLGIVTAPPTLHELNDVKDKQNALILLRTAKAGAGIPNVNTAGDHADPFGHDQRIDEALLYLERVCQFLDSATPAEQESDLYRKTMGAWRAFSPLARP